MEDFSFSKFPSVSPQDWKHKIIEELKGKPFDDLIWRTQEGFDVQPFYTAEDLEKIKIIVPQKIKSGWEIRQDFVVKDVKSANKNALDALASGAESIGFDVSKIDVTKSNLQKLLAGINTAKHPVHFTGVKMKSLEKLVSVFTKKTSGSVELSDSAIVNLPEIADYAIQYPFFQFISLREPDTKDSIGNLVIFGKGAGIGPTSIFEHCLRLKIPLKKILPSIQISIPLSNDYFTEIARIRAFRLAWAKRVNEFQKIENVPLFIHAENIPQKTEKGEEHFNILRATTTAMAAIIGGCDSLSLKASPMPGKSKAFSKRIYRNIQLLLKHESYFEQMQDVAAGSYYIESLTQKFYEQFSSMKQSK